MKNKIKQTSWVNRLIIGALFLIATTNPWSVGYISYSIEKAIVYFTIYSNYAFIIGLVLLALVNIYMMYTSRQKVHVPKKSERTHKAGKFLED